MNENLQVVMRKEEFERYMSITKAVPGYSGLAHYNFFTELLKLPINNLLMLGVYFGRDICFLLNILKFNYPSRKFRIIGVDKFDSSPCADWSDLQKSKTWKENEFGEPPDFLRAVSNTSTFTSHFSSPGIRSNLIKSDDSEFLETITQKFDCVYLDTAHDEATVLRQIQQCRRITHPDSIICGDDWADREGWGVKSAVEKSFHNCQIFHDRIWATLMNQLK